MVFNSLPVQFLIHLFHLQRSEHCSLTAAIASTAFASSTLVCLSLRATIIQTSLFRIITPVPALFSSMKMAHQSWPYRLHFQWSFPLCVCLLLLLNFFIDLGFHLLGFDSHTSIIPRLFFHIRLICQTVREWFLNQLWICVK